MESLVQFARAAVLVAFLLGRPPLTAAAPEQDKPQASVLDVLPDELAARPPGPNWLSYNGDFTGRRYSSLSQITAATVSRWRRWRHRTRLWPSTTTYAAPVATTVP